MDSKLIEEINAFKPPILKSKLKIDYNLLYWRIRKTAYDLPLKLVNNGRAERGLIESSSLLCACFVSPHCKHADRLLLMVHVMCFYLFVEDFHGYDKSSKGFGGVLDMITGSGKTAKSPTEIFIETILSKIKPVYTAAQLKFFKEKIYDFVDCVGKEVDANFDSIEEIIESRLNTNGAIPWYTLIDYFMDTDHSKWFRDQRLVRYVRLMNTHALYANDVYSLKKECHKQQDLKLNTIYYYYQKGNSIEKSVEIVLTRIDKIEDEMLALSGELTAQNQTDSDFLVVLESIEYMAGGNLFWSQFAPWYNIYNKIPINDIFADFDHFIELRDEFDANTFENIWTYTYD